MNGVTVQCESINHDEKVHLKMARLLLTVRFFYLLICIFHCVLRFDEVD